MAAGGAHNAIKTTFRGVEYPSISACAKAHGVKPGSLHRRVTDLGETMDEAMRNCMTPIPDGPPCVICGKPRTKWKGSGHRPTCCYACKQQHIAKSKDPIEIRPCECGCSREFPVYFKSDKRRFYEKECRKKVRKKQTQSYGNWGTLGNNKRRRNHATYCHRDGECVEYGDCLGSRKGDCYRRPERTKARLFAVNYAGNRL